MSPVEIYGADTPEKQRIALIVAQSIDAFLQAGIAAIERECNERRLAVMDYLGVLPPQRTLPEWGLPNITVEVAMQEANPAFVLADPPDPLRVFLTPNRHPWSRDAPMSYDPSGGIVYVHLPALPSEGSMPWFAWHEMLHACGDLQFDGIVRHNKIGLDAVLKALTGQCPEVGVAPSV